MIAHGKQARDLPARRWRRTVGLAAITIVLLAVLVLVVPALADRLNTVVVAGFPLGYFMAAQGSLLLVLLLTVWFILRQERLDREGGVAEPEPFDAGEEFR